MTLKTADYMVLPRGNNSMVKTLQFFKEQGGDTEFGWGISWRPVKATDIEHARVQASIMTPVNDGGNWTRMKAEHKRLEHKNCDIECCNICNLFVCENCASFEGGLTSECPMRIVDFEKSQQIYHGLLDFYNGEWVTNHRTTAMYPQDEFCEFCRGENPHFNRDFFTKDFKLWHAAKENPDIVVRCHYGRKD